MSFYPQKLAVLGDRGVGKTSLLSVFSTGSFPDASYSVQIPDGHRVSCDVDKSRVQFSVFDVPAYCDEETQARILSDADVILLCFSVEMIDSWAGVVVKWTNEVRTISRQNTPLILVANKRDLRYEERVVLNLRRENNSPVTYDQGQTMATRINASAYVECSAKTKEGVTNVFKVAARTLLRHKKKTSSNCVFL